MSRPVTTPGRAGFLLVEALLAIVVLSVGILVLAAEVAHAGRGIGEARMIGDLATVGQAEIERVLPDLGNRLEPGRSVRGRYRVDWERAVAGSREYRLIVSVAGSGRHESDTLVAVEPARR